MRRPSLCTHLTSSRKGGFRPDSIASLLSLTCRSGSGAMPLCRNDVTVGNLRNRRAQRAVRGAA